MAVTRDESDDLVIKGEQRALHAMVGHGNDVVRLFIGDLMDSRRGVQNHYFSDFDPTDIGALIVWLLAWRGRRMGGG